VRLSPLTLRLVLFAFLSILVVNAALAALGDPTSWDELRRFGSGTQGVDSWRPMNQARVYLALEPAPEKPLYQWLFFEQRIKFIYPPTSLLLLDGMPGESLRAALNLFSWLLVLMTVGFSVAILDRGLQRSRFAASGDADRVARAVLTSLLALGFYPVLKAYSLGQMQVWVNALFAACLWCWLYDRKLAAGVLVTLMAAVKPQYGVIALWGVLRREHRFVVAIAVSALALLGVSVLRFGWEHHVDYLSVLSHVSRHGEAYWPNQTLNGFLQRLLGNGVSTHWDPHVYPPYHAGIHLGTLAGSVALLSFALFWPAREAARGGVLDLAAMALAVTIASPIAWEHHYGVLLPIFALLLPTVLAAPRSWVPLAIAYAVAATYLHALSRLSDTAWNPLQSLLLFVAAGVFVLLLCVRSVKRS
jgi:hypothetical protein